MDQRKEAVVAKEVVGEFTDVFVEAKVGDQLLIAVVEEVHRLRGSVLLLLEDVHLWCRDGATGGPNCQSYGRRWTFKLLAAPSCSLPPPMVLRRWTRRPSAPGGLTRKRLLRPGPQVQQCSRRPVGRPDRAIGGAGHNAVEQPEHRDACLIDVLEGPDEMDLGCAQIGRIRVDTVVNQGAHNAFGPIHAFRAVHRIIQGQPPLLLGWLSTSVEPERRRRPQRDKV
jgi:hypothetical protein